MPRKDNLDSAGAKPVSSYDMKQKDYRLAAIMFTDIRGFSRMMERDEAGTLKLLQFHNELVVGVVKSHSGTVIKTIGDAFLIDFKNTVDALRSGLEIQDKLYAYNKDHPDFPLLLRIGLHLGDITFYESDALGEGINIASRLQSIAHPGCICMSQDVYNLVLNKIDFQAEKLGRVSLKNISKEIHAYEITTPNVEFDPDHDKPRPGYKPGAYSGASAEDGDGSVFIPEPTPLPGTAAPAGTAPANRGEPGARGARTEMGDGGPGARDALKRSILNDIKVQGRRLSVEEVREKYGMHGDAVETVIADLASKGILQRQSAPASVPLPRPAASPPMATGQAAQPSSYADRFLRIGEKIVDEMTKSIESGLDRSRRQEAGGRAEAREALREARVELRAELRGRAAPAYPQEKPRSLDEDYGDPRIKAMNTKWERKLANSPFSSVKENFIQDFGIYRDQVAAAAKRSRFSFIPNLASWIGVSGLLFFINAMTHTPPWSFIPFTAWGIGIVEHFFAMRRKAKKASEIDKMPALNPDQLHLFKRINLAKDAFTFHGVSTVSVSVLLGVINAFTVFVSATPIPWALIPIAALAFSFISHAAVHFSRVRQLESTLLKSLGLSGSWEQNFGKGSARIESIPMGPYQEMYAEAMSIKAGIIEQLKRGKKRHGPMDKDLIPALDEYIGQIRLLATRAGEVDAIVDTIPMAALTSDKEELLRKEAETANDRMKREYRKSIEEIEHQERSFTELENQREMLKLRLKSGVNSLKQMRIEVARLSTMPEMDEDSAVLMVKQRSLEISEYLEDLRSGFEEGERDPYQELADAENKRLEADRLALMRGTGGDTAPIQAASASLDMAEARVAELAASAEAAIPSSPGEAPAPSADKPRKSARKPKA